MLLQSERANVFEYILSGKSTWRSTPSELRFFFWEEGMLCLEIEERMYSNTYCPESQRGDQPLQSCVFFFERKECFAWKLKSECIQICCPESQRGDQPLQSFVFFFFFERKESFAWKLKSECLRIYIVWKVNVVAINPFRAAVCFESRERPSRKFKKIAYAVEYILL